MIHRVFASILLTTSLSFASEAFLGRQPSALSLSRGVMQVSPYVSYMNIDIAEGLGLDI